MFAAAGDADFYLPAGTWTHLLTGERLSGPGWHHGSFGFDSLPLLVRPGSVLPRIADGSTRLQPHRRGLRASTIEV